MKLNRIDPRNILPLRIESTRLTLRPLMRADVPAIAELADNHKIFEVLAQLPHPYTRNDAVSFVQVFAQRPSERLYAILPRGGQFIGVIGLHFAAEAAPELGYWLGEPFWGQGYMSEAAQALVGTAQLTGQFPVLKARALVSNLASIRVLEKAGFARIGERLDTEGNHDGRLVADFRLEARR